MSNIFIRVYGNTGEFSSFTISDWLLFHDNSYLTIKKDHYGKKWPFLIKLPYLYQPLRSKICVFEVFNKAIINIPHLCKAKKRVGMWEQQKMLPKMNKKIKFTAEITISDNNFWKYCVFWNMNDVRWMAVNFGSKIKFFQANFLKIVFLDLEIVCNFHTFSENCLDLEWFKGSQLDV